MEPDLKLAEELFIPKSMKGGNEAWVYIVMSLLLVGLGAMLFGTSPAVRGRDGRGRRWARVRPAHVAVKLARTSSSASTIPRASRSPTWTA